METASGYITEKFCEETYLTLFGQRMAGVALMLGVDRSTTEEMFRKVCISLAGSKRGRPKACDIRKELARMYPPKSRLSQPNGEPVPVCAPPKYPHAYPFQMHHLDNLHTRRAMAGGVGNQEPSPLPDWATTPEALAFVSKMFAQSHAPYQMVALGKDEHGKAILKRVDLEPDELNPAQLGKSMAYMLMVYGRREGVEAKPRDRGSPDPQATSMPNERVG